MRDRMYGPFLDDPRPAWLCICGQEVPHISDTVSPRKAGYSVQGRYRKYAVIYNNGDGITNTVATYATIEEARKVKDLLNAPVVALSAVTVCGCDRKEIGRCNHRRCGK